MNLVKPPAQQAAFTLLELIIVVAVLAILAALIYNRPSSSDAYQQDAVIEQIISAGQLAQQMAMNDSSRSFSLDIQANQIDLLHDEGSGNFSISPGFVNFPLNFGSKVSLSTTQIIAFDRLGAIIAASRIVILVDVNGSEKNVCFELSGYIHRC